MKDDAVEIYVCDDEDRFLQQVQMTLTELGLEYEVRCNVHTMNSPASLLELDKDDIDILFLDIEMPEMDGMTAAQKLRDAGFRAKIIFLTNHKEFIQKAFEVKAFRFLYKPCSSAEIREAGRQALREILNIDSVLLRGARDGIRYQVYLHDVYYLESLGEGSALYTEEGSFTSGQNLRYWQKLLEPDFFKCHRSYLVNLRWIRSIDENDIVMYNRETIPLAQRKRGSLRKEFELFVLNKAQFM